MVAPDNYVQLDRKLKKIKINMRPYKYDYQVISTQSNLVPKWHYLWAFSTPVVLLWPFSISRWLFNLILDLLEINMQKIS